VVAWTKELHHAETSLDPGYSPSARLNDAAATRRLAKDLTTLGLSTSGPTCNTGAHSTKRGRGLQDQITDLGLTMVETKACRQLGGAPT
jgi:hypothetical protein